jgi:hypothetical protein
VRLIIEVPPRLSQLRNDVMTQSKENIKSSVVVVDLDKVLNKNVRIA